MAYMCGSLEWILNTLVPGFEGPALYQANGGAVHAGGLAIAWLGLASLVYLNYRGVRSTTFVQDLLTYGKSAVAVIFIVAGLLAGHASNLRPPFLAGGPGVAIAGIVQVIVLSVWFFGGFSKLPQAMEEKSSAVPLALVGRVLVWSIVASAVFYTAVIVAASMAMPWPTLVKKDLVTATAFQVALGSIHWAQLVLVTGLLGAFTVANSSLFASARILLALGRAGLVAPALARIDPVHGSPVIALAFVGLAAGAGLFLGRKGLLPIVDVGAAGYALGYVVTCIGVVRMRRLDPAAPRAFRVPGGTFTATLGVIARRGKLLFLALYEPFARQRGRTDRVGRTGRVGGARYA